MSPPTPPGAAASGGVSQAVGCSGGGARSGDWKARGRRLARPPRRSRRGAARPAVESRACACVGSSRVSATMSSRGEEDAAGRRGSAGERARAAAGDRRLGRQRAERERRHDRARARAGPTRWRPAVEHVSRADDCDDRPEGAREPRGWRGGTIARGLANRRGGTRRSVGEPAAAAAEQGSHSPRSTTVTSSAAASSAASRSARATAPHMARAASSLGERAGGSGCSSRRAARPCAL